VVAAQVDVHEAGDELVGRGVSVLGDALDEGGGAIADADQGDAHGLRGRHAQSIAENVYPLSLVAAPPALTPRAKHSSFPPRASTATVRQHGADRQRPSTRPSRTPPFPPDHPGRFVPTEAPPTTAAALPGQTRAYGAKPRA